MGILRIPGSKQKHLAVLRSFIDPLINSESTFVDLFVGGGSVLLDVAERYPDIPLVANDADEGIAALWSVVAGDEADVVALEAMLDVEPTRDLWEEVRHETPDDSVRAAFAVILLSRTNHNGSLQTGAKKDISSRYNPVGIRKQIRKARDLLRGRLTITSMNAMAWFDKNTDDERSVVFADPPYVAEGNDLYRVGMSPREHAALRDGLRSRDGWVLTYRDHVTVRHLYDSWADVHVSPVGTDELVIVPGGAPGEIPAEDGPESDDGGEQEPATSSLDVGEVPVPAERRAPPLGPSGGGPSLGSTGQSIRQFSYRVKQAAPLVGFHENTLLEEIRDGRLKAKKKGRATVILHTALMAWLNDLPDYER